MKRRTNEKDQWRKRILRVLGLRPRRELRLPPGLQRHEHLFEIVKKLRTGFEPYGRRKRGNAVVISERGKGVLNKGYGNPAETTA